MSHPEQLGFFAAVATCNQELIHGARVLEIGAHDVNGGVRKLFWSASEYIGVDLSEGPGVDLVGYGHEIAEPDGSYDIVVSGECFEHDPHWRSTFANMVRLTRPGGLVAFTCAARGRPEHGTIRSDAVLSPGTQSRGLDYYKNLSEEDFRESHPLARSFSTHMFWYLPLAFDLYFAGVRRGGDPARVQAQLPTSQSVQALRGVMPLSHKAARAPLAALSKVVHEPRYQRLALPYWSTLIKAQDRLASGRFRRTPEVRA